MGPDCKKSNLERSTDFGESILEKSLSLKTFDMSKQMKMMTNSDILSKLKDRIRRQKESRGTYGENDPIRERPPEKPKTRKVAVGPSAPKYKGFNTAEVRIKTNDGAIWKEDFEQSRLNHTRMYKPVTDKSARCTAASVLLSKSQINLKEKPQKNQKSFLNKTKQPVRKTGKITVDKPSFKNSIITPASWRQSKKKIQIAMQGANQKTPLQSTPNQKAANKAESQSKTDSYTSFSATKTKPTTTTKETTESSVTTKSKDKTSQATKNKESTSQATKSKDTNSQATISSKELSTE